MTSPMDPPHVGHEDEKLALEKNAGLIMSTNNSSIVSKRSVEKLYLPEPHFYRYFVRKAVRRAPTINRGYWLRMRAIDWVIRRFLEKPSDRKKVIINLGCGYDPVPFQWLAQDRELCKNTKFIDVDFEELMVTKREIILSTPKMRDLLTDGDDVSPGDGVMFDSAEYAALGCDLRNLKKFGRLLKSVVDIDQCLVLCVAEVSITYMAADDSDALIEWTSKLSSDVTFCLLEQQSPDRFDNAFTASMMKHFAKLGTPLRSLTKYPGNHTQVLRFQDSGYPIVEHQSLWELWADPRFLSPSQRMSLDDVEPFDEWEEFALFASHYCLIVAQTGEEPLIPQQGRSRRTSMDSVTSDLSARTVSPYSGQTQWFAYKYAANPKNEGRTHHASAYSLPEVDGIGLHGGVGPQTRLSTTSIYASANDDLPPPALPPLDIGGRSCHTITTMGNGQNILVGGRGSPSSPMKDCWVQTGSTWERVQDLPEPRFRHRAAAVVLPDGQYGVVVFGGKTSATKIAIPVLLWDKRNGWQILKSLRSDPMPRFGASFVRLGFNHGLLFGGMRHDGVICQGLWRWRLMIRNNVVVGIRFKTSTAIDTSVGIWPWLSRLGASYSVIRNELLVIGGIARHGCIPKDYEILSILGSFSAFGEFEKEMELRISCVLPKQGPDMPRPFLVGHSTHRTSKETSLIVGGGATCFSFGAYWNPGCWLLYDREAGVSEHWEFKTPMSKYPTSKALTPASQSSGIIHPPISIDNAALRSSPGFLSLISASTPVTLASLSFGPCVSLWTASYLLSKIPSTRSVVVHDSPCRTMNFQRKDFAYKTLSFHDLVNRIACDDSHLYLRSLSLTSPSSTPANLASDWPEIAQDFVIPSQLSFVQENLHSSPLRISSSVNMWLHYDVMANVLFQVRGTRKLILFPPSDLKHLGFPPGSTTSTFDVLSPTEDPDTEDDLKPIPETHPHIAILRPGDALFIPPLWAHTGTPLAPRHFLPKKSSPSTTHKSSSSSTNPETVITIPPSPSNSEPSTSYFPHPGMPPAISPAAEPPCPEDNLNISVNLFFRSFPTKAYPAGRDVYGNRDIQPYEDGRRDLDKIVRRFTAVLASSTAEKAGPPADGGVVVQGVDCDVTAAVPQGVPKSVIKAYLERLADEIRERAGKL